MNIQISESPQKASVNPVRAGLSPRRPPLGGGFRRGGAGGFGGRRGGLRRGGARGGMRRGGGANNSRVQKTAAELDADLDSFTAKMQTD